jgi:hypothetical protein
MAGVKKEPEWQPIDKLGFERGDRRKPKNPDEKAWLRFRVGQETREPVRVGSYRLTDTGCEWDVTHFKRENKVD